MVLLTRVATWSTLAQSMSSAPALPFVAAAAAAALMPLPLTAGKFGTKPATRAMGVHMYHKAPNLPSW